MTFDAFSSFLRQVEPPPWRGGKGSARAHVRPPPVVGSNGIGRREGGGEECVVVGGEGLLFLPKERYDVMQPTTERERERERGLHSFTAGERLCCFGRALGEEGGGLFGGGGVSRCSDRQRSSSRGRRRSCCCSSLRTHM